VHVDLLVSMFLYSVIVVVESSAVPQRVQCVKCGSVLYEGVELTPPDEIIQRFDGRCPKCGKKLTFEPGNVSVKPIDFKRIK